jgi:hypothetical protein
MPPRVVEITRSQLELAGQTSLVRKQNKEVLQKQPVRQKFELSNNHYDSTDKRRLVDFPQRESGLPRTKPLFLGLSFSVLVICACAGR